MKRAISLICCCVTVFVFAACSSVEMTGHGEEYLAAVALQGGGKCYGFIDEEGNYKIEPQFNFASGFDENGLAFVGVKNGQETEDSFWGYKWGYINTKGEYEIEPIYDYASAFIDGVAYVKKDGEEYYINMRGERVFEDLEYEEARYFTDGMAAIKVNGLYGFIDTSGEIVISPQFKEVGYFSEGKVEVARPGENVYGFIDKAGNWVIEPKFSMVEVNGFNEGLVAASVPEANLAWGYYNEKGECVIECQYDQAYEFSEGLAAVARGMYYGYINKKGDWAIPPHFVTAGPFSNGLAGVSSLPIENEGAGIGYIDKQGKFKIKRSKIDWYKVCPFEKIQ